MTTHRQEIYAAAKDLQNRKTVYGRAVLFKRLGGSLIEPDQDGHLPEEYLWRASLFGTTCTAANCDDAVQKWAQNALGCIPRLSTGEPVDCPYNGAGIAPGDIPPLAA